jgi:hypothetical protein
MSVSQLVRRVDCYQLQAPQSGGLYPAARIGAGSGAGQAELAQCPDETDAREHGRQRATFENNSTTSWERSVVGSDQLDLLLTSLPSVCLSVCPSVCLPVCRSVDLSDNLMNS